MSFTHGIPASFFPVLSFTYAGRTWWEQHAVGIHIIDLLHSSGESKGAPGTRAPPPGVQILSFSCSFQQIIRKIIGFWELAPPPGENPGSATAQCFQISKTCCKTAKEGRTFEYQHSHDLQQSHRPAFKTSLEFNRHTNISVRLIPAEMILHFRCVNCEPSNTNHPAKNEILLFFTYRLNMFAIPCEDINWISLCNERLVSFSRWYLLIWKLMSNVL